MTSRNWSMRGTSPVTEYGVLDDRHSFYLFIYFVSLETAPQCSDYSLQVGGREGQKSS